MARRTQELATKKSERNLGALKKLGASIAAMATLTGLAGCSPEAGATNNPTPAATAEATPTTTPEVVATPENPDIEEIQLPSGDVLIMPSRERFDAMTLEEQKEALKVPAEIAMKSEGNMAAVLSAIAGKIHNQGTSLSATVEWYKNSPDKTFDTYAKDLKERHLELFKVVIPNVNEEAVNGLNELVAAHAMAINRTGLLVELGLEQNPVAIDLIDKGKSFRLKKWLEDDKAEECLPSYEFIAVVVSNDPNAPVSQNESVKLTTKDIDTTSVPEVYKTVMETYPTTITPFDKQRDFDKIVIIPEKSEEGYFTYSGYVENNSSAQNLSAVG